MKKRILTIGLVLLFIFSSVVPISIGFDVKTPNIVKKSSIRGNTLYVGGSGPNNYTKIKDAINDSVDGDTVYVYNDSSPYIENIIVDKSITILGEDRNTTIINGSYSGHVINITSDEVTINGFSIISVYDIGLCGFYINANNIKILNNIIKYTTFGLYIYGEHNNVIISDNIINNNLCGIWINDYLEFSLISNNIISLNQGNGITIYNCINSKIINNIIFNNMLDGLSLDSSSNNLISRNIISKSYNWGVYLSDCNNNEIICNNLSNNRYHGIYIVNCGKNKILNNNFINNSKGNVKLLCPIFELKWNIWDCNYWNEPKSTPYLIICRIYFIRFIYPPHGLLPWFEIDWHPSKEPYDI